MNILYIGDVMGSVGLDLVQEILPNLINEEKIDLVIAQAENVTEGKGTSIHDYLKLKKIGVDFCMGGNWSMFRKEIFPYFDNPNEPIIRPANLSDDNPGLKFKEFSKHNCKYLFVSLLGQLVGRQADSQFKNPLNCIDEILDENKDKKFDGIFVNFHGDYSSEKVVIGHYLDGRVTAVIGDHWHVPTADYRVLPNATAHISDVGMCGILESSLGVSYESIIPRWKNNIHTRNVLETKGPKQFNSVLIETSDNSLAKSIKQIRKIVI